MDLSPVFFYAFAGLAVACALMVVFKKNPVSSAFSLILVFFAFAGIYAMLDAHLVAALQVLVYASAIMVLFIFVIMLLNADVPTFDLSRSHAGTRIFSVLMCGLLAAIFIMAFRGGKPVAPTGPYSVEAVQAAGGNTQVLSELMFSEYLLPFELTSVLLLAAIISAVAIAKRKQTPPSKRSQSVT